MITAGDVRARLGHRSTGLIAALAVLLGSLGIQISSMVSFSLFDSYSTMAVSGLRMVIAAVVLLAITRPNLRALGKADWSGILVFGIAMAAMNVFFYLALSRLPLGVAVTLEFLGAFSVAMLAARRLRDGMFALVALVGVALIAGPAANFDALGYLFGLGAAAAFAIYTVMSARIGTASEASSGLKGLALSVSVAAVVLLPFSVPQIPLVDAPDWGLLALSGLLGVAFTFSMDVFAAQLTSAATVGVLFSIDPVTGALVGALLMGQSLSATAYVGIVMVAASGAFVIWRTNRAAAKFAAVQGRDDDGG
ncbi:EamA family transporter [Arthrobacter monumenti]